MKTRTIQLTEEQGKKLKAIFDKKQAYHDAICTYGPKSEEAAARLRDLMNKA